MMGTQPTSFRLSKEALDAIAECERLGGIKRSAVIELAARQLRDALRKQGEKIPKKSGKPS